MEELSKAEQLRAVGLLRKALIPLITEEIATKGDLDAFSKAMAAEVATLSEAVKLAKPDYIDLSPVTNLAEQVWFLAKREPINKVELPEIAELTKAVASYAAFTDQSLIELRGLIAKSATVKPVKEPAEMKITNWQDFKGMQTQALVMPKFPFLNTSGQATQLPLVASSGKQVMPVANPDGSLVGSSQTGVWGYKAGTSGTATLSGSKKVLSITVHSTAAGSLTINGGDSITIPALVAFSLTPQANLVDPALVFTGTDSYFIEYIT